ncbi:MAG: hypothetical protein HKO65_12015 [Gemmatimonadetes bacterium]|nr:Spy/CpxP family protein refolding chaperone [Gemmatimonadota bacterium]NNM05805.1 hypothetical protein [Gemmatimonadota bacterium]
MRRKWRWIGSALLAGICVAVMPLEAQRGQGRRGLNAQRPQGPNMGRSIELALEHQEALGLENSQVAQLQELQAVMDGEVAGLVEEMRALQQGIRDGEIVRDDGLRQMGALRGELITASAPLRGRVQEILTAEQHNKLQPLVREGRPSGAGARSFRGGGRAPAMGSRMGRGRPGRFQGVRGGRGLSTGRFGQRAPRPGRRPRGMGGGWGGGMAVEPGSGWNLP